MIGLDLDGVLLSRVRFEDGVPVSSLLLLRSLYVEPMWVPSFPYVIITGRPDTDSSLTEAWIEKFLRANPPLELYHANKEMASSAQYKHAVLSAHPEIDPYIEDDPTILSYLRCELPARQIVDLPNLISLIIGLMGGPS